MHTSKAQQGSVTLLTLIIIVFLTTLATGLAGQIQTHIHTVLLAQQETRARYAAEAGINAALAEIMKHPQTFRSQWQEILPDDTTCSAAIVITKRDKNYVIYADGNFQGIHHKMTASVADYPSATASVLIQNNFASQ